MQRASANVPIEFRAALELRPALPYPDPRPPWQSEHKLVSALYSWAVDEELYTASNRLLLHGLPSAVPRELDDEHRIIPLGVDIDQNVAVTAFLCWLAQEQGPVPGLQILAFRQDQGQWEPTGAASGPFPGWRSLRTGRPGG